MNLPVEAINWLEWTLDSAIFSHSVVAMSGYLVLKATSRDKAAGCCVVIVGAPVRGEDKINSNMHAHMHARMHSHMLCHPSAERWCFNRCLGHPVLQV